MIKNLAKSPLPRNLPLNTSVTRGVLDTFHPVGFMGYRLDRASGNYILGNGYRIYNPIMRAFYSPDSESPFGAGGLSRYAYCGFDPVNFSDPSGHISVGAGIGIGLGILGIVLSFFTLGASLSLLSSGAFIAGAFGVTSGVLGGASAAAGIASAALEESDPEMSAALGWASLGLGIGSMITGRGFIQAGNSVRSSSIAGNLSPIKQPGKGRIIGGLRVVGNRIQNVHGYPGNVLLKYQGQHTVSGRVLSGAVGGYLRGGGDITLTSCFGGFGGKLSAAQLLANQTGRTVHAAFGFHKAGNTANNINRTFTPLTGVGRTLSNAGGLAFSGLSRGVMQGYLGIVSAGAVTIPQAVLLQRR